MRRSSLLGQAAWCNCHIDRRVRCQSRSWGRCLLHSGQAGTGRPLLNKPALSRSLRSSLPQTSAAQSAGSTRGFAGWKIARNDQMTARNLQQSWPVLPTYRRNIQQLACQLLQPPVPRACRVHLWRIKTALLRRVPVGSAQTNPLAVGFPQGCLSA